MVEDDYDSEFRYDVAPVPALAALDRERVVYLGTVSKSLSPGMRVGWLVGPPDLVAAITRRRDARRDLPSWPIQKALLSMLREGHADKLVRSARRVYAERSRLVAAALGPFGDLGAAPAGMYLTVRLPADVAIRVQNDCRRSGFDVPLLSDYARTCAVTGLVVGFGGVTDDELTRALKVMSASLRDVVGTDRTRAR